MDGWERWSRGPLIVLSAIVLVAYSALVLAPAAPGILRVLLFLVIGLAWLTFILDYVLRFAHSTDRRRFARKNRLALVSAIIPIVRPFYLLRYLHLVRGFRGESGRSLRSRLVAYALSFGAFFLYVIALTELAVERGAPHASIRTFGDAVWWAFGTISTVGYGDVYPVTTLGRILAIILMGGGFAMIATASATLVSYLSERIAAASSGSEDDS